MKVKEPLPSEYKYFRPGLLLFTYLHLAADKELTDALLNSGVVGLAYETVQPKDRSLPLLAPMLSPTREQAAKCSTASMGCSENTASSNAGSRISPE